MHAHDRIGRDGAHPEFCRECREDAFDYGFVQVAAGSLGIDALAVPIADQAEWDEAVRRGAGLTRDRP